MIWTTEIWSKSILDAKREVPGIKREADFDLSIVSIVSPGKPTPSFVDEDDPHHLHMKFFDYQGRPVMDIDEEQEEDYPSEDHIRRLIDRADTLLSRDVVYCHCEEGISRSAAAAYILHCIDMGEGSERSALKSVYLLNERAQPNRLMVGLADDHLGRGGEMVDTLSISRTELLDEEDIPDREETE